MGVSNTYVILALSPWFLIEAFKMEIDNGSLLHSFKTKNDLQASTSQETHARGISLPWEYNYPIGTMLNPLN